MLWIPGAPLLDVLVVKKIVEVVKGSKFISMIPAYTLEINLRAQVEKKCTRRSNFFFNIYMYFYIIKVLYMPILFIYLFWIILFLHVNFYFILFLYISFFLFFIFISWHTGSKKHNSIIYNKLNQLFNRSNEDVISFQNVYFHK